MAHPKIDPELWEMLNNPWLSRYSINEDLLKTLRPLPPAVFEFDTAGDTQGFAGDYIRDDKRNIYGPPITVSQFSSAQYNKSFPLPMGTKPPTGVIIPHIGQWGPFAKVYNFPQSSAYWSLDVVSPDLSLSSPWQSSNGVEVWLYDQYTITGDNKSCISVEIIVLYSNNGTNQEMSLSTTNLKFNQWVQINTSFSISQNMTLKNLIFRLKGEWAVNSLPGKARPIYEGQVLIDHIAAIV